MMSDFGWSELLIIGILVVVLVGPDDLPKMMRLLGKGYAHIRRASDELRRAFMSEVDKADAEHRALEIQKRREELQARRRAEAERLAAAAAPVPTPPGAAEPLPEPTTAVPEDGP